MFWLLARQIFRTHRKQLALITTLIMFSLSLFVGIWLFVSNVNTQISNEIKPLIGADIIVQSAQALSPDDNQTILSITSTYPAELTKVISFSTNLTLDGTEASLIQVKWVENNYPLYGVNTIKNISDTTAWALVDQQTYDQYVQDGTLLIWAVKYRITGIIQEQAWASINVFDEWRTVILPYDVIQDTQLTQLWSRVSYETLIKIDDENALLLLDQLQNTPQLEWIQISNWQARIGQIQNITKEFDRFSTIVLIITFILVATTIFISIRTFFANEQRTIGIQKILWQRTRDMVLLYWSIFVSCFVVWIIVACMVWVLISQIFETMSLTQEFVLTPHVLREMLVIWCILALTTITLPVYTLASTSWLALLRPQHIPPKASIYKQTALLCIWIYSMYLVTLRDWSWWLVFLGVFAIYIWLFWSIITVFLRVLKKYTSTRSSKLYLIYDGIRTSVAPGNQSILMSIGLCTSIISLVVISWVSSSFLDKLSFFSQDQPSLYILNILPDDVAYITQTYPRTQLYDVILARIQTINTVPLQQHLTKLSWWYGSDDTERGWWDWRFTREFNITTLEFAAEEYITGTSPSTGEVSLEEWFAAWLEITLGDTMSFFIQWREFELQVTSLRKEDRSWWPFFYIQFPAEQFASTPKTYFWTYDVPADQKEVFKQSLIKNLWPHLSFVDTDDIIQTIQDISTKLIFVIWVLFSFLLFFVFVSIVVCLTAMKTLKKQKVQIYWLLWATTPMIQKSLYAEQWAIFWVAFVSGLVIAIGALSFIFSKSELLERSASLVSLISVIMGWLIMIVAAVVAWIYRDLVS